MEKRVNVIETLPEATKAMYGLEKYLSTTQLTKIHKELIKIRASQINGCAYCIDMHTKDALKYGETPQRIFLLNAWRETSLFTEQERVILAMTEEITLIHHKGLSEKTYQSALQIFDETYIAQLIMAIITINAWNRIGVSTNLELEK
ncbi:MAG: carboxymuconolactone decarboxylase family protein [Ferruginibacter sp.]